MADFFDELNKLQQTPASPAPVASGAGVDEFWKALGDKEAAPLAVPGVVAPPAQQPAQPQQPDFFSSLEAKAQTEPASYPELLGGGLQRAWLSAKSSIPAWAGVIADLQGDPVLARQKMLESQAIEDQGPPAQWQLQNVSNPFEFLRWLTEKFGENAINLVGAIPTGGTGALFGQLAAKGLVRRGLPETLSLFGKSRSAAELGAEVGAGTALYPYTVGLETPQTAQEQFQVTEAQHPGFGTPEAGRSLAAGAAKGVFELWTPLSISRAMFAPGLQLGKTYAGAVAKTFAKEAGTETAQEAIDIYARQLADPGYSYFTSGPTLNPAGFGPGAWRLLEAGTAGGFLGAAVGALGHYAEKRTEARNAIGTQPEGERVTLPVEGIPERQSLVPAIRMDDGKVFTGVNHGEALLKAKDAGYPTDVYSTEGFLDGFVAKDGTFLDREQAASLVGKKEPLYAHDLPLPPAQLEGPVTALRRMVMRPDSVGDRYVPGATQKDTLPQEVTARDASGDLLDVGALIAPTFQQPQMERFLDLLDANTPRYMEVPQSAAQPTRVYTDTELELEHALNRPQGEKPQLFRVDQGSLQPAAITAHVMDIADPSSGRVWFLQGVTPEQKQQLLTQYAQLQQQVDIVRKLALLAGTDRRQALATVEPLYNQLLTAGLRVIPSRGAGFHYNGVLNGDPISNLAETKRSKQIAFYDLESGNITPFTGDEASSIFSAADEGVDLEKSVVVSIDTNRISEADVVKRPDGTYELKKPLQIEKLVPGIQLEDISSMFSHPTGFLLKPGESMVLVNSVQQQSEANRIGDIVKPILPVLSRMLKETGIESGLGIHITDSRPPIQGRATQSPAWAHPDTGIIGLSPERIINGAFQTGDLTTTVLQMVMHEFGHIITYNHFKAMPAEIQQQLIYGWNKARIAYRMGDASRAQSAFPQAREGTLAYWHTFPEWLAEQYRRWATSDKRVLGWVDAELAGGAKKLERFYNQWERQFGKANRLNVSQPDYYFSAWMEYLRNFGAEKNSFMQLLRQQALKDAPSDLRLTDVKEQVSTVVEAAVRSMSHMLPQNVQVVVNETLDPHVVPGENIVPGEGAAGRWVPGYNLIELAIGSLPIEEAFPRSQAYYGHELFHAYESLGLVSPQEIELLMRDIRGRESQFFEPRAQQALQKRVSAYGEARGWSAERIRAKFEEMRDRELRAYYMQSFIETGRAWSEAARGIFARLVAMLERIANAMRGLGYQTREDVVRAFFRGEMVQRQELNEQEAETTKWVAENADMLPQEVTAPQQPIEADKHLEVEPGVVMHARYMGGEERNSQGRLYSRAITYTFTQGDLLIGAAQLQNRGQKGFEIRGVQTQVATTGRLQFLQRMLEHISKDVGIPLLNPENPAEQLLKPPAEISKGAMPKYKWMARGQPNADLLGYYVTLDRAGNYFSPNFVRSHLMFWQLESRRVKQGLSRYTPEQIAEKVKFYSELKAKIPESVWADPRLEQMFALPRSYERDEVQGSVLRAGQEADEGRLYSAITGMQSSPDVFTSTADLKQKFSQAENARATGMAYRDSAPSSILTYEVRRAWDRVLGVGESAAARAELVNTLHEADRIWWFTKKFYTLQQITWRNEHLPGLRNFNQHAEMMNQIGGKWLSRADETARMWNKAKPERREAISKAMFALSEMQYRTPAEVAANVTRNPAAWDQFLQGVPPAPRSELSELFKKAGVKPADYSAIRQVYKDYADFVNESAGVESARLQRTLANSPQKLATALAELQKQVAELRGKPFFPHMRFGRFTITVRDQYNKNKIVYSSAYETTRQREAALRQVRQQHPGLQITFGEVQDYVAEFMGLPPHMLKAIKEQLLDKTGKTAQQAALIDRQLEWIEEFEHLHAADRTFRRTWAPAHSIPGYSTDAFRAYTSFFMHGSRYLARLAAKDLMLEDIASVNRTVTEGGVGNTAKRQMMVRYMQDSLRYMMEGGRDSGKFRGFLATWFLGYSGAATAMNATQVPMVTMPWLSGNFGLVQANGALVGATNALKAMAGGSIGTPAFMKAREELKNQGRLETGQAADIAGFAEGMNLLKAGAGTSIDRLWKGISYYGMYAFSKVEQANREVTFKAAWDLSMKYPNTARLQEIERFYPIELADLRSRVGLSHQEALAFMFAKESVDRTQGLYAKYNDPPFMRGPYRKNFLVFFRFTQMMLYAFAFNKSMFHMLLLTALVYGLSGVPGAEDGNELIRLLAMKLFGKDVDLLQEMRSLVRTLTRGTIFDEKGPDLVLHGISREGFGLGLLPQSWGAPRFDASANGSLGKIIPGLAELAHGIAQGKDKDLWGDAAQRAAGAGYGMIFSLMHYIQEPPGTMDSKKWEQLLPRAARGWAKAWRYGVDPQAETTSAGAKIVQFDVRDPGDLSTVIAQALGFTPTKVSERWELQREMNDSLQIYRGRRAALYAQMNRALLDGNPEVVKDVAAAIERYNEAVMKLGDFGQAIKTTQLISSLKQRNSKVQLMEQLGVVNKNELGVMERMKDLYPGVRVEKVK